MILAGLSRCFFWLCARPKAAARRAAASEASSILRIDLARRASEVPAGTSLAIGWGPLRGTPTEVVRSLLLTKNYKILLGEQPEATKEPRVESPSEARRTQPEGPLLFLFPKEKYWSEATGRRLKMDTGGGPGGLPPGGVRGKAPTAGGYKLY